MIIKFRPQIAETPKIQVEFIFRWKKSTYFDHEIDDSRVVRWMYNCA